MVLSLVRKVLFFFSNSYKQLFIVSSLIPLFFISQLNLQDENLLAEIHQTQQTEIQLWHEVISERRPQNAL